MHRFELVSNLLCPFTQRAAIQLAEKGLPCERTYIDLAAKPEWFDPASPLGKVPLLRVGDAVLFETSAICEYIEDVAPAHPMWPSAPLDRARHRGWTEFASAVIADVFGFYTAPDANAFDRKCSDLAAKFRRLDRHLDRQLGRQLGRGPFFDGHRFGLVDAAFAPVFRLFDTFDAIGDFGLFAGQDAVPAYRRALAERPSVQQAVAAGYGESFRRYLLERGSQLSRLMGEAGTGRHGIPAEQQGRCLADR